MWVVRKEIPGKKIIHKRDEKVPALRLEMTESGGSYAVVNEETNIPHYVFQRSIGKNKFIGLITAYKRKYIAQQVADAFNESGETQFDYESLTLAEIVKGAKSPPTY